MYLFTYFNVGTNKFKIAYLACIIFLLDRTELDQYFSNFNVHMNHLVILLKCRFWFRLSVWVRLCDSVTLPDNDTAVQEPHFEEQTDSYS